MNKTFSHILKTVAGVAALFALTPVMAQGGKEAVAFFNSNCMEAEDLTIEARCTEDHPVYVKAYDNCMEGDVEACTQLQDLYFAEAGLPTLTIKYPQENRGLKVAKNACLQGTSCYPWYSLEDFGTLANGQVDPTREKAVNRFKNAILLYGCETNHQTRDCNILLYNLIELKQPGYDNLVDKLFKIGCDAGAKPHCEKKLFPLAN